MIETDFSPILNMILDGAMQDSSLILPLFLDKLDGCDKVSALDLPVR